MINFLSKIYWGLGSAGQFLGETNTKETPDRTTRLARILDTIRNMLNELLLPFLIAIGAAGTIYAIWLGVNYSKSEGDARTEAKKRIVNFLIGFICVMVLLVLLELFVKYGGGIVDWLDTVIGKSGNDTKQNPNQGSVPDAGSVIKAVLSLMK